MGTWGAGPFDNDAARLGGGSRALDRIVGEDSEWRALWEESEESYPQALASVRSVRAVLEQATGA